MAKRKRFEIRFYEGILEKSPNLLEALICLGDAYTKEGFFAEGLAVDRKIVSLRPNDAVAWYNLSCSLSILGKISEALSKLKKAVSLGYEDFSHMLGDPDLENLRALPEFDNFFAELKLLARRPKRCNLQKKEENT